MDANTYTTTLAELRVPWDEIKRTQAAPVKRQAARETQIAALAGCGEDKAERIAPAVGLSLAEVVAIAPGSLAAPDGPALRQLNTSAGTDAERDYELKTWLLPEKLEELDGVLDEMRGRLSPDDYLRTTTTRTANGEGESRT